MPGIWQFHVDLFENVPVILSTSIPSLETYKNVKSKKYNLTKLNKRYKDFSLPNAEIINLNLTKKSKKYLVRY